MPGEEIYGAMDRGVVDICKWGGFTTNWNMKFHEVAAYVQARGWQKPGMNEAMEINKDRWDGLSEKHKRLLRLAIWRMNYHGVNDLATEAEYYPLWIDYGVTVTQMSAESLQKMKDCADVRMNEISDKNPLFKEIWESHSSFLGGLRNIIALKAMPVLD
jgi:TRAP-type mannitol/chloroaromatic compound transport system substrate-binding protein